MMNPSLSHITVWLVGIGSALASLLTGLAVSASPARAFSGMTTWLPPVVPTFVERPFDPPASPWDAGHRGVDLRARPGQPVRAPADGVIHFAGALAGRPVISLAHAQPIGGVTGWRTTYEGVVPRVTAGARVTRGQVIGEIGVGGHCVCLHWGLRRGERYADPMSLLGSRVVLKPLGLRSGAGVRLLKSGAQSLD
jgi:murein DD-endopeptidase MepM/ murein hydrolase activator NlpD